MTLDAINNSANWTPVRAVTNDTLSISASTLADGDEIILVDDVNNPTKIYGDLTKTNGTYTLTKPSTTNAELTSINASEVSVKIAPDYAGVNLVANRSNTFSNTALNNPTESFTLDATGDTPILSDNVKSLTLTNGIIKAAVNQIVTANNTTITPSAINGDMIISTNTISGIVENDAFALGDKNYKMLNVGLFNDTDNTLVTSGISGGALTFGNIAETALIAIDSAGALDLSGATAENSLVVNDVENPASIYGELTKNENIYTLNPQGTDGVIQSVTMPSSPSTLTTYIAATINAPLSSNTFTINDKEYNANNSALVINAAADGATSTLTQGTVLLADSSDAVTTTSGSKISYTTDGDGMTVRAANGAVNLGGLTSGDTFTVDNDSYKVTDLGFIDANYYLWTSTSDYADGVAISDTGNDGIKNSANWTKTVIAEDGALAVTANTLSDGETVIIINSSGNSTNTLGTLSRTSDTYTLTKSSGDINPSSISVKDTALEIDEEYAAVPVTANGATFTVTADDPFTVDATGDVVEISNDATAIEIIKGTIAATTRQTVTATSDSGNTKVIGQGNGTFNIGGETFTVAANENDITFGMVNGEPTSVGGLEADATVSIDGTTYTAPEDDSTLKFTDADGWYFDGYIPSGKYNITVDGNGNITVDPGVKFTDVVSSGKTLPEDNTINLAADVNSVAVNVTNNGATAIAINDKDGNPLVENLGTVSNVTFDSAGVMVERTSDVAGAVFTIGVGKSLETETATITSNASNCEVGVGTNGTALSVDKSAEIFAPANTELTLGTASYTVNGVDFSTSGTAQASVTSGGVKLDLGKSDSFTYDEAKMNGTDTATANIDSVGGVSLTSGASLSGAGAANLALNVAGTITLDGNTIDAATATDVTAKANGIMVGDDDVTVTGDDDGYKVNIVEGVITGLENVGNANGVTVGGLSNGTIKTDKVGSFTSAGRTFLAIDDASVTYGIEDGKLTYANDVDSIMSGDFTDGLRVNGGALQVTGAKVSLDASTDNEREVMGFGNNATLTTAQGVDKIETNDAGKFTFGNHVFETDDNSIAFNLFDSSVTGIDSLESGTLIISQDETNLGINDKTLTLTSLSSPVTLRIANSKINSVYGLEGAITGLDDATLYNTGTATVNGKALDIEGSEYTAVVEGGALTNIYGLRSGATVNAAPNVSLRTAQNGTFTFRDDQYKINDTLDGVVIFSTNLNSYVTNIGELEGSVSGGLDDLNLNGKAFGSSNNKVTVATDGEEIIGIYGLSSGDTITGSLSNASYLMPKGTLTVNDQEFILKGDDDGVSISGGNVILGLDKDASLTVAKGGDFSVNSDTFADAPDNTTFIAGRNNVYIYDPNNKPISEKTDPDDIIRNLIGDPEEGTISLSGDSAAAIIASGDLDSPMALTLDNSGNKDVQTADFSESRYTKRVTLLGGDQDVKFNDEGKNSAYVAPTANGKKNIELGNGGDVAVNDSPYAKVSIKTGKGEDTIVNRNGASTTVDVKNNGDTTIVPTSGRVTLENYDADNKAKIRTFEYTGIAEAVKDNTIKFGDGVMTLGDAVVVFDPDAKETGGTFANLVDYEGDEQRVGFTHSAGGVLNASTSSDDLILKGGYVENSSDKRKTGPSTLIGGKGNDTILAGEGDLVRAGAGDNEIFVTDKELRGTDGATIVLGDKGRNTIHGFNNGYEDADAIRLNNNKLSAIEFIYDSEGLVMRSGNSEITFDGLEPAESLVTYDDSETAAPYELKLTVGNKNYNVAVAQENMDIGVDEYSEAEIFYGVKNVGSGLNFSEYSGPVEVNLSSGTGTLNGSAAQFFNINKVTASSYDSNLIGAAGKRNTLIAGTGNTSISSGAGRDLMVGNNSEEKDGVTTFFYTGNDGRDTITNFNFMASAEDYNSDIISLPGGNVVSDVYMSGNDVVMGINGNADDYLTLQEAAGQDFKINDRIAKVDNNTTFDNLADFYVLKANNATMSVGADIGDAQIWLDDRQTGEHGVIYHGEIKYLNASNATGNTTLVGNDLDNVITGGKAANSIWGGYGMSNDTLVGGSGHNTFFFGYNNGNDTITSANAGDVIDLSSIALEEIAGTTVTAGGTKIELTDGSSLDIQSNAADVEYKLIDGSKYTADHGAGHWTKK